MASTTRDNVDGVEVVEVERHPVEQVALVVPTTDDPTTPVLTFRAWFLGILSCSVLIFLNTFFLYRTQPLTISAILVQVLALPVGRFMAKTLPEKHYRIMGWSFTLNPGPFNIKEHVIITVFASCGVSSASSGGDVYPIGAITIMRAYYKETVSFVLSLLIVQTSQLVGYGWAGMLRRYLIDPAEMWWPANLAQVSLFRALHEKETNSTGPTRMHFFFVCFGASFIYYIFPGYVIPVLTFFSWVCWVSPRGSVTAQQIGSGYQGLGLGTLTLDWAGISAYQGSPLVCPWFSILNTAVGFILFIYIIVPLCYWKFDAFESRKFPIFSNKLFTTNGTEYNTARILTSHYDLNIAAYETYGKLYLSPLYAISVGSGFARFTATLTHVALFNGSTLLKQSKSAMKNVKIDVHAYLMKNYKGTPEWWYQVILFGSIGLSLLVCFVWADVVQLPWWGFLFAFGLAWLVTLPIGIIQATTNKQPGYDVIAQYLIGYTLPGKPIANLIFKIYGRISTANALSFLSDLKLGQYMKIPPRCMFKAQLVGTLVAGTVHLATAWWMLGSIDNICDTELLSPESPWTCPKFRVSFDASVIWGLIGPKRLFGPGGTYHNLVWLFIIGAFLPVPVWFLSRMFPQQKWIPLINIPVITSGFANMPPATPTNMASWLVTGAIFSFFVFRYKKDWWSKYNYILSAGLDAGTALMAVFLFFALQNNGIVMKWWGTEVDHCPLASCPTAPGIHVKGCPVF